MITKKTYLGQFISDVWRHLSNTTGNQLLADIIASHRSTLGEGVVHGSEQVQRTLLECRQQIAELPDGSEKTAIIDQRNEIDRQLKEMDFLYEIQETPSTDGFVYLATSPILDAVKIGKWSGTMEQLQHRYTTYYGYECTVAAAHVPDRHYTEKALHRKFAEFNIRSAMAMNENLPKGELFNKAKFEQYKTTVLKLANEESFEQIQAEFLKHIEARGILGYYTSQEQKFYELNTLCEAVYTTMTEQQIKNKWRSSLESYRVQLENENILHELKGTRYVKLPHFLIYCLKLGVEYDISPTWTERMEILTLKSDLVGEHPGLNIEFMKQGSSHALDSPTLLTAKNVAANATDTLWLKRNLATEANRRGFPCRVFGKYVDLYNIKHLAVIGGPFSDVTRASKSLCTVLVSLSSSCMPGIVAQRGETYVSRGTHFHQTGLNLGLTLFVLDRRFH